MKLYVLYDIDDEDVMESQNDLVYPIVKLEPLGVIIGSSGREFKKKKKK